MLRIQRTLSTISPAIAGFYLAGQNEITSLLLLGIIVFFLHISGNAVNDIADYETDKINAPDRVLVSGILSRRQAVVLSLSFLITGLLLSFMLDWLLFIVVVTLGLIFWMAYNFGIKLKNSPAGSIFYLSLVSSTVPFLGGFIVMRNLNLGSIAFALFLTVFTCSFIIISLRDFKGDMISKKKTIVVTLGKARARIFSILLVILPLLIYPIISPVFGFLSIYLLYAIIPISLRLVIVLLLSRKDLNTPRYIMRLLTITDFTILALAKPESSQFWLQL